MNSATAMTLHKKRGEQSEGWSASKTVPEPEDDVNMSDIQECPMEESQEAQVCSPGLSPTPRMDRTSRPIELQPNIAPLCNPNNEEMDIRQPHTPLLFDNNLDAVHKPSWIGSSTCEPSLAFLRFTYNNIYLAEFEVFISGLTNESIDRAIASFQEGIHSRKVLPGDFDPHSAQITCNPILQIAERGSTAMSMVRDIPIFWINLDALIQSSNLNAIESSMTRVFCMQGAMKFHHWLLSVVPTAVTRTLNNTHTSKSWIDRLAMDIQSAILRGKEAKFHSSDYLPNLFSPCEYVMKPRPFRYDKTDLLTSTISSTLRCWLRFPTDEQSLAQLTLLDIVSSKSPTSILFVDKIWDMYTTPFSTVFNNNWDIRRSKPRLTAALAKFEKEFALHPFANPGSLSYRKLQHLSQLIGQWMEYITTGSHMDDVPVSRAAFVLVDF